MVIINLIKYFLKVDFFLYQQYQYKYIIIRSLVSLIQFYSQPCRVVAVSFTFAIGQQNAYHWKFTATLRCNLLVGPALLSHPFIIHLPILCAPALVLSSPTDL